LLLNSGTYGYAHAVTDVAYPFVVDIEIEIDLIEQHVDVNGNSTYFIINLFGIRIQFYYNEVTINQYFGGSSSLTYSHPVGLSGTHTLKVCRDDTGIIFYIDGSLIYTTTQMYFKNNRIGLASYAIEGWYANVTRIESIRITNPDNLWTDSFEIFEGSKSLGIYTSSDAGGVYSGSLIRLLLFGDLSSNNNIGFELIDEVLTEITFNITITLSGNPSPGDTLTLKGSAGGEDIVFTFVDFTPVALNQIQIGADTTETATNIAAALNNIEGAEFVATADGNVITITAYSPELEIETDSDEIDIGIITKTTADIISEEVSVADSFTATEGGKSVQENVSVSTELDGLIDGLSETVSATAVIDCLMDSMDENANASAASDNFDGLIDYMGDET